MSPPFQPDGPCHYATQHQYRLVSAAHKSRGLASACWPPLSIINFNKRGQSSIFGPPTKFVSDFTYLLLIAINLLLFVLAALPSSTNQIILSASAQRLDSPPHSSYGSGGRRNLQTDETDFNEFAEFEVDPDHTNHGQPQSNNGAKQPSSNVEQGHKQHKDTSPHTVNQANKNNVPQSGGSSAPKVNEPTAKEKKVKNGENKAGQSKNPLKDGRQEYEDDDDEFELQTDNTKPKEDLKMVNAPLPVKYTWDTYYVEIMFMIVIALYFVNFFIGSGKNEQIACLFYEANRALLKQNFALVGGLPQTEERNKDDPGDSPKPKQQQRGLIKETESSYMLWCSGRVGMEGILIEISLLKRQDLLSMFMNMLKPSRDNFTLRMQLNPDGIDNFVFCLAQKSASARLAKEMIDINTFCPERKPVSRFGVNSEKLYLMNEIKEVASFLFDPKTSQLICKYEDCIDYIHITDQYSLVRQLEDMSAAQKLSSVRRMATFSFNFPKHSQTTLTDETSPNTTAVDDKSQNTKTMVLLALTIVDKLRRFRLSRDGKQKSEKNRQKITDILQKAEFAQRQEAAQAKKDELRRQEKERIYEEDDPEKQRKWEKKEAKREMKKSRKVKQLKVKSK